MSSALSYALLIDDCLYPFVSPTAEYVKKYATEDALRGEEDDSDSSESTMSDFSDDETKDMEL